jgi:hypothetical protein
MKTYVVCISDAASADRRTPVMVQDDTSLGRVAQMAIDEFVSEQGELKFPVFIDIHPAEQFGGVHWLHSRATTAD